MRLVTPEVWYRAFWVLYGLAALIAARIWLVNPILRAIEALKK